MTSQCSFLPTRFHDEPIKRIETTEEYRIAQGDTITPVGGPPTVDVTKKVEVTTEDSHRWLLGILWDIMTLPFHAEDAILQLRPSYDRCHTRRHLSVC
jgi:hypothetical protein